jgi:hypothetical protein
MNKLSKRVVIFLFTVFLTTFSCSGGEVETKQKSYNDLKSVPDAVWKKLGEKKVYFGHQSVGFNIIDGIKDVMKEYRTIKINIVETSNPADFKDGIFAHSKLGSNTDPLSKINDFATFMNNGLGNKSDIAFMKLCYVDINENSDVNKVFSQYEKEMTVLKSAYNKTIFVHLTVPLTYQKANWKTWIKKILGKNEIWEYDSNIKKNEFNQMLRRRYKNIAPVFDIAEIESTFPDGSRSTFKVGSETFYQMVPDYTNDGGHLNKTGRRKVAEQLILLLANL